MSENKSKLKICIIDDSDNSRKAINEILESEGYIVVGNYAEPEQALKEYRSIGANLFLIDIVMPEISGLEVAKYITDHSMDAYIIMMSSLNNESIVIEAISQGATDFLQKPFEREDLLRSVEKILGEMTGS